MAKNEVAILDFGSSKITILVGVKGVNNTFKIIANVRGRNGDRRFHARRIAGNARPYASGRQYAAHPRSV